MSTIKSCSPSNSEVINILNNYIINDLSTIVLEYLNPETHLCELYSDVCCSCSDVRIKDKNNNVHEKGYIRGKGLKNTKIKCYRNYCFYCKERYKVLEKNEFLYQIHTKYIFLYIPITYT